MASRRRPGAGITAVGRSRPAALQRTSSSESSWTPACAHCRIALRFSLTAVVRAALLCARSCEPLPPLGAPCRPASLWRRARASGARARPQRRCWATTTCERSEGANRGEMPAEWGTLQTLRLSRALPACRSAARLDGVSRTWYATVNEAHFLPTARIVPAGKPPTPCAPTTCGQARALLGSTRGSLKDRHASCSTHGPCRATPTDPNPIAPSVRSPRPTR